MFQDNIIKDKTIEYKIFRTAYLLNKYGISQSCKQLLFEKYFSNILSHLCFTIHDTGKQKYFNTEMREWCGNGNTQLCIEGWLDIIKKEEKFRLAIDVFLMDMDK